MYRVTRHERLSPRGKEALLAGPLGTEVSAGGAARDEGPSLSAKVLETVAGCVQCGACAEACPTGVRADALIRLARATASGGRPHPRWLWTLLTKRRLLPSLTRLGALLPWSSGLIWRLLSLQSGLGPDPETALPFPSPAGRPAQALRSLRVLAPGLHETPRGRPRIAFFLGCVQNYLYPKTAEAVTRWFGADIVVPRDQGCCGLPAWSAGAIRTARHLALRHLASLNTIRPDYILTACASCAAFLATVWPEVLGREDPGYEAASVLARRVREFSQLVVELGIEPPRVGSPALGAVAYHCPCHQRLALKSPDTLEAVLARCPGADARGIGAGCCGQGGLFGLGHPSLAGEIFEPCLEAWRRTGAPVLVTTCSGCLLQWRIRTRAAPDGPRVCHLAETPFLPAGRGERLAR